MPMSFSALRNVGFVRQTIHKLYTNKPQTLHKTQHCNYAQNPAQQRCILFLNADKNEMSEWFLNADKTNGANVLPVVVMRVASPPFAFLFFVWCVYFARFTFRNHSWIHSWAFMERKGGGVPPKKTNKFERFFGDSTLTFLTFGNTFRLPILPTLRVVLLRSAPK